MHPEPNAQMQAELHAAVVREVAGVRERLLVEQEVEAAAQLSRAHEARERAEAHLASVSSREAELAALARELELRAADLDRRESLLVGAVREAARESAETILAAARREAAEIVAGARAEAAAEVERRAAAAQAARDVRSAFAPRRAS